MCPSPVLVVSLCLLLCLRPCLSSEETVTVKPGGDATLQCRGSAGAQITVIKWLKTDMEIYASYYRDNGLYKDYLHLSYRGRVELKDPEMKDGDVSVVLKNVTFKDAGRYQCYVGATGSDLKFISSFDLTVQDSEIITAEPGQSVSLPCRAPSKTEITAVEWTRPEQELEYVLTYLDGKPNPDNQHPSYQNRVELEDREMKDGDVSIILKNVKRDDAGTYECRVFQRKTKSRKKRASLPIEPISIVHLQVHQPGDKEETGGKEGGDKGLQIGLGVVLTAAALVVVVVGFIFYRKRKNRQDQADPEKAKTGSTSTSQSVVNHSRPGSESLE